MPAPPEPSIRLRKGADVRVLMSLALCAMVGALAVHISSCTAIGFGIGALVDARSATRLRAAEVHQIVRVERGTVVRLLLSDSTVVRGRYVGPVERDGAGYTRRYEAWRAGLADSSAPALGARIVIERTRGRVREGTFEGFDQAGVRIRTRNPNLPPSVPWAEIARVHSAAGTVPGDRLRLAFVQDRLPLAIQMGVRESSGGIRTFDLADIVGLEVARAKHGRMIGTAIGFAADAAVVVAVASATSSSSECGSFDPQYTGGF